MPARFAQREFEDGFNKVGREKNGERNFEAKSAAFTLTDERCIELARQPELGIVEWIELTGVGIGECHGFFLVATDGVSFIKHKKKFIKSRGPVDQAYMLRDNQHEPLTFPCTPARMVGFLDSELCTIRGCFSVPDAFQQAVTENAPTTDTPPRVLAESQGQTGTAHSGVLEVGPDDDEQGDEPLANDAQKIDEWIMRARDFANGIWLRELNVCKRPTKEGIAPEIARRLWESRVVTKLGKRITAEYLIRHALRNGWNPPEPD